MLPRAALKICASTRIGAAIGNVVPDGSAKENGILQNEANLAAQGLLREFADVGTVDLNDAGTGVVEASNEVDYRGFSCASWADEGHHGAGFEMNIDVAEDRLVLLVRKIDMLEINLAFEARRLTCAWLVVHFIVAAENFLDAIESGVRLSNRNRWSWKCPA